METITGNFARVIGFVWCTKVQRVLIEIIYLFLSFDHKLDLAPRTLGQKKRGRYDMSPGCYFSAPIGPSIGLLKYRFFR